MNIACVGAGPAGLYLAILMKLHDANNEVTIFEQNPVGVTHGWGVVFWEDLLDSLRDNDPDSARDILSHSFGWSGQVLDVSGKPQLHDGGGGFGIGRQRLLDILANRATELGVKIRFEHEIDDIAEPPLRHADLIIASDGAGSQIRRRHADRFGTKISVGRNKYVWLGTNRIFDAFTFGFVPSEAGWIWFHAYAFDDSTSTFIVECSPETWKGLGFDTLDANESLKLLERIFDRYLNGFRLISHSVKGNGLPWLNFRGIANRTWHLDNIVLVGDAAHTTHFSIGSGTQLAIQDAISLAKSLQAWGNVQPALQAYESERRHALEGPRREARLSAQWFENIPRYINTEAQQFFRLLRSRRSRLMPYLPPGVYYRMYNARQSWKASKSTLDRIRF
jgi:2-polyprenyl-6-methoxyphenol hydroxylase-like FAD-dependent oxidoreductase